MSSYEKMAVTSFAMTQFPCSNWRTSAMGLVYIKYCELKHMALIVQIRLTIYESTNNDYWQTFRYVTYDQFKLKKKGKRITQKKNRRKENRNRK